MVEFYIFGMKFTVALEVTQIWFICKCHWYNIHFPYDNQHVYSIMKHRRKQESNQLTSGSLLLPPVEDRIVNSCFVVVASHGAEGDPGDTEE